MNLVQITPGAGGMFCGNCLRDNALVAELRRQGHGVLMVPLYLPLTLDEEDQSAGTPVFYGGVNVYLDQKFGWFRSAPAWVRRVLSSPAVLHWAAGRAAKTRAVEVGDLTVSILRGDDGNQWRDLEECVGWLKTQTPPDAVCLSNALLIGLARRIRQVLGTRILCTLQGEDAFLDSMPEPYRTAAWQSLVERCADVDLFVAPSRYYADQMSRRLAVPAERIRVVANGISLDGYESPAPQSPAFAGASASEPDSPVRRGFGGQAEPGPSHRPAVGFFARLCRDKGLDTLVEAFIRLRQRARVGSVRLRLGGNVGPGDEGFVRSLRERLDGAGLAADVDWVPNPDRAAKLEFLRSLTVFSVPARSGEAFGLYVLEALAAGVPVVQPRTAAFPEILAATGGGLLHEPESVEALADALEELLQEPERARSLGEEGQRAVFREFNARRMAENLLAVFAEIPHVETAKGHRPELATGERPR